MKKRISILSLLCLCAVLLSGCGGDTAQAPVSLDEAAEKVQPTAPAETEDPNALVEYVAEGVGTFYLPAGFEMACQAVDEPLPMHSVSFTKGPVTIYASRFGADAYEAAGVPMPADLEDYSTRDGVRKDLPEDAQFATDDLGNMYVDWIDSDGQTVYYVLKAGNDSYGCAIGYCPPDEDAAPEIPLWLSKATLN